MQKDYPKKLLHKLPFQNANRAFLRQQTVDQENATYSRRSRIYSGIDQIPRGQASKQITPGALVLEGGAFRGLYTQGLLDALMEEGLNFQTTVGISAGALGALGYVAGEIGWSARLNLSLRHDSQYIGLEAMRRDHGITGFSYIFQDQLEENPLDLNRLFDPRRRLVVGATNMLTGQETYFENGKCADIFRAARASATVPYLSRPVVIDQVPYLDGGMACHIPYPWAKEEGYQKIIIVRTRDIDYRRDLKSQARLQKINRIYYHHYPALLRTLEDTYSRYNQMAAQIEQDRQEGKIFVFYPQDPITISRFEPDMEKLGALYWKGYHEGKSQIPALLAYLQS